VFAVASGAYEVVIAGGVQQTNSKWSWKEPAAAKTMSNLEVLIGVYGHLDQGWELPNMNMVDHILNQWMFAYAKRYGISPSGLRDLYDDRVISNWLNGLHTPGLYFNAPMEGVLAEAGVSDIHEFLHSPAHNPVILWPLTRWDYTRRCDGASAIVICASDSSKYATSIPIHYLGTGNALQASAISRDMYTQPFIVEAGRQAYEMAGISAADVDVVEMYDFVPAEYCIALEDLGYWGPGQTAEMLAKRETLYSGTRPVNPSSGGVTCGVTIGAVGAACTAHLVRQLRGEAGVNQVKPLPKVGLVYDCGAARNAVIHVMGR
jgi:acetyl-CoA C-acetyltransferase